MVRVCGCTCREAQLPSADAETDLQTLHEILEARGGFGHREHLELAWTYLRRYPTDEAAKVMVAAIRRSLDARGRRQVSRDDHARVAALRRCAHPTLGAESFEEFIDRNPDLLDRKLIEHFYSRELILTESARAAWVRPDLRRLPALV